MLKPRTFFQPRLWEPLHRFNLSPVVRNRRRAATRRPSACLADEHLSQERCYIALVSEEGSVAHDASPKCFAIASDGSELDPSESPETFGPRQSRNGAPETASQSEERPFRTVGSTGRSGG